MEEISLQCSQYCHTISCGFRGKREGIRPTFHKSKYLERNNPQPVRIPLIEQFQVPSNRVSHKVSKSGPELSWRIRNRQFLCCPRVLLECFRVLDHDKLCFGSVNVRRLKLLEQHKIEQQNLVKF